MFKIKIDEWERVEDGVPVTYCLLQRKRGPKREAVYRWTALDRKCKNEETAIAGFANGLVLWINPDFRNWPELPALVEESLERIRQYSRPKQ